MFEIKDAVWRESLQMRLDRSLALPSGMDAWLHMGETPVEP
jgi:hypothetical protein